MEVMRIWQGGCIIRSQMLAIIPQIYQASPETSEFLHQLQTHMGSIDTVVQGSRTPIPAIASAREYLKALMSKKLSTNLIQAMRDHF